MRTQGRFSFQSRFIISSNDTMCIMSIVYSIYYTDNR